MAGSVSKMVELVEWFCGSANLGYDQWNRWDFPAVGDTQYAGECDCSSLVYHCAELAGFNVPKSGSRYTGTMRRDFTAAGFVWISDTSTANWQPGDILYKDGHTAIWTGKYIAEAYGDERGGSHSGKDGDQANETRLSPKRGGWLGYFRYPTPVEPVKWPKEVEPVGDMVDYIVEEGSNGIAHMSVQNAYSYRYEKWASGKLVCYISDYFNGDKGDSWKGSYYLNKVLNFPEWYNGPEFLEPPYVTASARASSGYVSIQFKQILKNQATFYVFGSRKDIPTFYVDAVLVGSWK